jgi:hypothetical protein
MKRALVVLLGSLSAGCLLALAIVLDFSLKTDVYECLGHLTKTNEQQTAFMEVTWYSPWLGRLRNMKGIVRLDLPKKGDVHYKLTDDANEVVIIRATENSALNGHFSLLTQALSLETPYGVYDATCNHTSE